MFHIVFSVSTFIFNAFSLFSVFPHQFSMNTPFSSQHYRPIFNFRFFSVITHFIFVGAFTSFFNFFIFTQTHFLAVVIMLMSLRTFLVLFSSFSWFRYLYTLSSGAFYCLTTISKLLFDITILGCF
jgi:hypothetical protein